MRRFLLSFTSSAVILFASAQDNALTVKDYQHAEMMMGYNTQQYIDRGNVNANWFGQDKFWYRVLTPEGSEFVIVDAVKGTRISAFDQQKLAGVLGSATNKTYKASMLPFQSYSYTNDGSSIIFRAEGKQWRYDLKANTLVTDTTQMRNMTTGQGGGRFRGGGSNEVRSPDGNKAAFIKDYNLFYFDSFGFASPLEVLEYKCNKNGWCNSFKIQQYNEVICGHYCIYVLYRLSNGFNFYDILDELVGIKSN